MFWKKKQFWGGLIALALLAWCVKDIRLSDLQALSQRVSYLWLIPAAACSFVFIVCKALRWRLLISQHKPIAPGRVITLYSAGQILNIVMPALTGQVGRMILFARKEGLRKTFVFSTIVIEILFDALSLVTLLFLASLAFVFPEEYRSLSFIISGVTLMVLVTLYLILTFQTRLEEYGRRRLRDRWPGLYVGVLKFFRSFIKGMETLRCRQDFAIGFVYSLIAWVAHTLVIFFLFKSFGFALPLAAAAVVMVINTIALMVPVTPGNAGTFEVAVSAALAAFHAVARSDAVLFAVALHLLDFLPIFSMGYVFMHLEKVSLREIKSEHEDDMIQDRVTEDGELRDEDDDE